MFVAVFVVLALALASPALGMSTDPYVINACTTRQIKNVTLYPGFCAFEWITDLHYPRVMQVASNNDVIYSDYTTQQLTVAWEESNGTVHTATLVNCCLGLNHGLSIHNGYLYASSANLVFRWAYTAGTRSLLGSYQVVINNICPPARCHDHITRAIVFDAAGLMYVQSGSGGNVDPDATKSMIRQFDISVIPAGGIDWNSGYVYAGGLRNEVGIRFDASGVLWGVENGRDDLIRSDLGDIHESNPSEELNKFSVPGKFYGYPYCWSEYSLVSTPDFPRGTQWADPEFWQDGNHTDAWCRNTTNVVPPVFNFDGHRAPLDIIFNSNPISFRPTFVASNAFVAFHGSSHRSTPVGYSVNMVKIANGVPTAEVPFFQSSGPSAVGPLWPYRPAGLAWYMCGGRHPCLLVSNGGGFATGRIVAILQNK